MKIEADSQVFTLKNHDPIAQVILRLLRASAHSPAKGAPRRFEKNDFSRLWDQLNDGARYMLYEISKRPVAGVTQKELQDVFDISWEKLRGRSNSIARVSARLNIPKPFRTEGYNKLNRVYRMPEDLAPLVQKLMAAKK